MLKKIMLPALLVLGMSAYAEEESAKGLIGVEAGYVNTKYNTENTAIGETSEVGTATLGLKLGAESRHYRVFIDSSFWYTDQYKKAGKIGASLQYLVPLGDVFNIFMGLNAGVINSIGDTDVDPYYGADLGVNLNVSEDFGIELGARYCDVADSNAALVINDLVQGYISAIFKFTSDY
ncbi:outer membrane beta-barrel protein [Sulfurimonas sp. HSL1-2]|uniref:outer membrane beta-barrel protein n=1 Tax=Thiomicrolovo zhangzhouensis TaxID=3131933 RepID=UPI0031FA4021